MMRILLIVAVLMIADVALYVAGLYVLAALISR
jgi:hypothetical protein